MRRSEASTHRNSIALVLVGEAKEGGAARSRLQALDGLRGVAAMVVVFHHALLIFPALAAPYILVNASGHGWAYALLYTPLHMFWEGQSAVYVFFVLSGVVLTLPVIKQRGKYSWLAYYPRRLFRLYLPIWGAVLAAVVWVKLVPREPPMDSLWLQRAAVEVPLWRVTHASTLILRGTGGLVSPLWSLVWEIYFSLLLPLFVWAGLLLARVAKGAALVCLVLVAVGVSTGNGWLHYLPIFMLGVLIAVRLSDILEYRRRIPPWLAWAVLIAAPILLLGPWLARALVIHGFGAALQGVAACGALLTVFAALTVRPLERVLLAAPTQWLGKISFSLYLTHEPVIIAAAFLLGSVSLVLSATIGIAVAIPLGYLFFRVVETPSHRFARAVGDAVDRARERRRGAGASAATAQ